jgi:hypothetical protein
VGDEFSFKGVKHSLRGTLAFSQPASQQHSFTSVSKLSRSPTAMALSLAANAWICPGPALRGRIPVRSAIGVPPRAGLSRRVGGQQAHSATASEVRCCRQSRGWPGPQNPGLTLSSREPPLSAGGAALTGAVSGVANAA